MDQAPSTRRDRLASFPSWAVAFLSVLIALPIVWLRYLPMTDLPQLYAVASIAKHIDEPRFGFREFYRLATAETPYQLPFVLAAAFGRVMSVERAMHLVAFLSVVLYPLAALGIVRALRKPPVLALLAFPFVFNRIVFWGLIAQNLSVGIALIACGLLIPEKRSRRANIAVIVLSILASVTHLFGIAVLLGYLALWGWFGDWRFAVRRALLTLPALAGAVFWSATERGAKGFGGALNISLDERVHWLSRNWLGGYQDKSESIILWLFVALFMFLAWRRLPIGWSRWVGLDVHDRVIYSFALAATLLYFIVPINTDTMKVIAPRFSVLGACLLPLAVPADALARFGRIKVGLIVALALITLGNSWYHLARFDREARPFDSVIEQLPDHPKLLALTFEKRGQVSDTYAYLHYSAIVQAEKGGIIPASFASHSWTMPVRIKEGVAPFVEVHLEWMPHLYNYQRFGYFYDYVLVRGEPTIPLKTGKQFPYRIKYDQPPWHLYERTEVEQAK